VNKRIVIDALKYLLALSLLVYVVWSNWGRPGSNGLGDVWQRHVIEGRPIQSVFLLVALVIFIVSIALTFIRWYVLVRAQDLPFTIPDALRLGLIGLFFNTFLPGSVGGDIIKAAALAREQSRRTVAVATVIMDRVIALWGLVWFVAILGGIFWLTGSLEGAVAGRSKLVISVAGAVVVVSLAVWFIMGLLPEHRAERFAGRLESIPNVGGSAAEFWRAVWMYRRRQKAVLLVLVMSWIAQVGFVVAFWCCAHVLWDPADPGAIPGLVQHFVFVPMGLVIQAAVPVPGGAGAGEFGFAKLYGYFGGAEAGGVLGSLVQRVVGWVLALGGLLIYLRLRTRLPASARPVDEDQPETVAAACES
jgi:uncharacterized membrane protein YbhN (UPF0104 family)